MSERFAVNAETGLALKTVAQEVARGAACASKN